MTGARKLLCIDAGNTMVKWCLHDDDASGLDAPARVWAHPTAEFKPFERSAAVVLDQIGAMVVQSQEALQAVLLCNVLGAEFEQAVRTLCESLQVKLHVLSVNANTQVRSQYANPASLGKDRWAACLAVSQVSSAPVNLLVSFGTATTLDALVNTGHWEHLGGFIVPGVQTMLDSLHSGTAELPKVEPATALLHTVWPISTQQAIGEGVSRAQLALIQSLQAELCGQFDAQPAVWLTGGFAPQMQALLPQATVLEFAVLKGLVLDYQLALRGHT